MKMNVEFNSIYEIKEFVSLFRTDKEVFQGVSIINGGVIPLNQDIKDERAIEKTTEDTDKEKEPNTPKEEKEPKKETEKVTKETIRANFSTLIKAGKKVTTKALMEKYGANKVSEIKEADYEAINADLLEAIRG